MIDRYKWSYRSGFSDRIKEARKNAGLTAQEAAEKLGTCQEYIYKAEGCVLVPNISRVCEMADLYNVSIDWLCGRNGA